MQETMTEQADESAPGDRLRPWLLGATCALFVVRPLFPSESAAQGDGLTVAMLWTVLAAVWFLGAIGRPRFSLRFAPTDAAVAILIVLYAVAGIYAAGHGSPRPAVNMIWQWIGLGLGFFLARQLIVNGRAARAVAAVMISLAVALAGYGLYQYFHELPQARAEYAQDPDRALREADMWFPPGSVQRNLFEMRLASTEPIGTFALTNSLAGYLSPWLVVLVGIGLISRKPRAWWTVAAAGLPIAGCLILTKSRSAYLATALGLLLVWLLGLRRSGRLGWKLPATAASLTAVLLAAAIAAGGLDAKVLSEASKSLGYRVQYWQSTLKMIGEHPLAGCGPGNFQHAYTAYKLPEASEEVADPHNFLLEVGATAGTPALLAMLAVLGCFAWSLWRHPAESATEGDSAAEGDRSMFSANDGPKNASIGRKMDQSPTERFVFGGAAFGFLLGLPLGLMSTASPGRAVFVVGLPLAVGTLAMLRPWVRDGRLPRGLIGIGLLVLLVNLLAAGGIGFPGVAGTFWLLLALGLGAVEKDRPIGLPRWAAYLGLAAAVGLAVACHTTAYGPVLRSRSAVRMAGRLPAEQWRYLEQAAAADPLSPEPWRQLAALALAGWQQNPSDETLDRFRVYSAKSLDLTPNSNAAWLEAGEQYTTIYLATRRPDDAVKAVLAYRRAVELYPSSGYCRAQLALALAVADDNEGFRREAEAALRLDGLTPHADKKLSPELRRRLERSE